MGRRPALKDLLSAWRRESASAAMMCIVEIMPSAASSATPMGGRRRHFDSPVTDWPWWLGPLALVLALILALFASLIVDIPLAVLGVHLNPSKPPGAVVVIDTLIQDAIFVGTAVVLAGMGAREVASWQFGLRPTPRWRAVGLVLLALLAFLIFVTAWSQLVHTEKDQVLEKLGTKEGTELLLASAALTCVVAPVCEELLFRGFIFTALRNLRGPWLAALLTGLIFGAVHSTSAPAEDLLPLAALGFLLCVLYRATGSLYPCIAVHAINNAVAFGAIEKWTWQIVVLLLVSLGCIALLVLGARGLGLIEDGHGEWETSAPGA